MRNFTPYRLHQFTSSQMEAAAALTPVGACFIVARKGDRRFGMHISTKRDGITYGSHLLEHYSLDRVVVWHRNSETALLPIRTYWHGGERDDEFDPSGVQWRVTPAV